MCLTSKLEFQKLWKVVRPNLKSAKSKLKLHFDENAQHRNLHHEDKVYAFLPIPGKPLQARYYGRYTV